MRYMLAATMGCWLVVLDQLSKQKALTFVAPVDLGYGIILAPTINTGGAWSWGDAYAWFIPVSILLACVVIVGAGVALYHLGTQQSTRMIITQQAGWILLICGALGNTADRIMYGHVIDFISVAWLHGDFPVCNFADIWLTLGGVMVLIGVTGDTHEK